MFGEPEAPGVVPRACAEIFQVLEDRRRLGIEYEIAVSYVEVFGQEVIDLLRDGQAVGQSRCVLSCIHEKIISYNRVVYLGFCGAQGRRSEICD